MKTVAVFDRLLNGSIDHCGVRGANGVTADSLAAAISPDNASQISVWPLCNRGAIRHDGVGLPIHRLRIRQVRAWQHLTEQYKRK